MIVNSVSHPCDVIDVIIEVAGEVFINRLVKVWSIGARSDVSIDPLTDVVTNTGAIDLEFVATSL